MGTVATEPELDLRIDLSQLAPHLQISAGVLKVALCAVHQVLKDLDLLQQRVREALSALELLFWLQRVETVQVLAFKLGIDPFLAQVGLVPGGRRASR